MAILVLGSTGTVGKELSRLLVEAGEDVRGATRGSTHPVPGVTPVRVELQDPETFGPALEGVTKLFVLSPSGGFSDAHALIAPLLRIALPQVERVVTMTAQGIEAIDELPLRRIELEIEASGVPFVHLRPNWFSQNFHTFWGDGVREHGVIALPAGEAKVGFVDTRDIAAAAAAALTTDDTSLLGRAYELTGPEAITHDEVAEILAEARGQGVRYDAVTDDGFRAIVGDAMSPEYLEMLLMLFGSLREGAASTLADGVTQLTGQAPRSMRDYAHAHRDLLRST